MNLTKEEQIDLIAGRIIDEYRKHPSLEWHKIAASKLQSQWSEYYSDQNTKPLVDEITTLEAKLKDAESVNEVLKTVIDSVCSIVDKKNYEEDSQLHDIYKIVNKSTN